MGKEALLNFSIPSLSEERDYVTNELLKKYLLYKKNGYSPKIPKNNLKKEFSNNKNIYLNAWKKIKKFKKSWRRVYNTLIIIKKDYNFKIFKNYEIRLTSYGTGGIIFPAMELLMEN